MSFVVNLTNAAKIENPFLWKPEEQLETVPDDMIGRLSLKIEEKSLEPEIEFESLILYLALSYEHSVKGNFERSLEILKNLTEETKKIDESQRTEYGICGWLPALQHLLGASTAHTLIHSKNVEKAKKEYEKIVPISSMDTKNRAAIWGFRASFYAEYGVFGSKVGVQYATKANEMDPAESLWFFIKGKLLGRVRRVEKPFDIPSQGELEALETAVSMESNAAYAIFTAQVYRETANRTFKRHRNDGKMYPNLKEIIDGMNSKSLELYKKSLSLKPHCSHINFRCAKGFMSLPPPFRDTKLAKKCILEGLKMSSTSAYGNHVMATYYERYDKDIGAAVNHLKICVALRVFGACVDLLRLEYLYYGLSKGDVLRRLNQLYDDFVEPVRRCQILSQFVSFHLFVEYDLEEAIRRLVAAFRLNSSCDDIRNHRSLFLNLHHTISLLDVVVDEVKIRLNDGNCPARMRGACNGFLSDLADLDVSYARNRPRHLRQTLLDKSQSFGPPNSSRRIGRCGVGRAAPPPALSTTLSVLQRRHQHVATDKTLQKIDEFTNFWKKEASSCGEKRSGGGGGGNDDDDNDDSSASDGVLRLAKIRYESKVASSREQPQQPQQPQQRRQHQQQQQQQRQQQRHHQDRRVAADQPIGGQPEFGLASLTLAEKGDAACDSDFEKCVLAYRRAKSEANAGECSVERTDCRDGRECGSAASAGQKLPHKTTGVPPASANSAKGGKKRDTLFDDYLARSAAELQKKFEPDDIRF